jgi:ribosome-binding factor A
MSLRTERLGSVLQKDLGDILQKGYQLSGSFVTVTNVTLTPDLGLAKVQLSIFAPGRQESDIFNFIEENKVEIRHELASRIRHQVRRIPELNFYKDESAEYVNKMEQIFKKIEKTDNPASDEQE